MIYININYKIAKLLINVYGGLHLQNAIDLYIGASIINILDGFLLPSGCTLKQIQRNAIYPF